MKLISNCSKDNIGYIRNGSVECMQLKFAELGKFKSFTRCNPALPVANQLHRGFGDERQTRWRSDLRLGGCTGPGDSLHVLGTVLHSAATLTASFQPRQRHGSGVVPARPSVTPPSGWRFFQGRLSGRLFLALTCGTTGSIAAGRRSHRPFPNSAPVALQTRFKGETAR